MAGGLVIANYIDLAAPAHDNEFSRFSVTSLLLQHPPISPYPILPLINYFDDLAMVEDGYVSSAQLEGGDQPELFQASGSSSVGHGRPTHRRGYDLMSSPSSSPRTLASVSPLPRSSVDSAGPSSSFKWQESPPSIIGSERERRDTGSILQGDTPGLVETSFDESILRALCDLDVSLRLLFLVIRLISMVPSVWHTTPS